MKMFPPKCFVFIIVNCLMFNLLNVKAGDCDENSSSSRDLENEKVYPEAKAEDPRERESDEILSDTTNTNYNDVDSSVKTRRAADVESSTRNQKKLKYYFSVSIQKRGSHYASGAVVDTKWILTVAEPFYNVRESINMYSARLGSFNCKKGGIVVPLKGIEVHPKYKYRLPHFDLALLRIPKLETDVASYVHPIKLAMLGDEELDSNKYWSTYWPRLIIKGYILPQSATERYRQSTMRVSPQDLIPNNHCKRLLKSSKTTLDNSSMCLEPIASYHSRCMPDAGAPIVTHKYLWAITSGWTAEDCLAHASPTLATKVSATLVRSWLKLILNSTSHEEE